jgi:regulator of sigma E protease
MSIILFVLILGALIFVHELGHFLTSKKNGIRVDEFAIGFPPTLFSKKKGETKYSLNMIPFGGYVKIFGENPDDDSLDPNAKDSFVNKSRWVQAAVLVAGVVFNIVFAWALFFIVLMSGMPAIVTDDNSIEIENAQVVVTGTYEESPAEIAGLMPGDAIISIDNQTQSFSENLNIEQVKQAISQSEGQISMTILRGSETQDINIVPVSGLIGDGPAIGISMDRIGTRSLPIHKAFIEAFKMTGESIREIFFGLGKLFGGLFTGGTNMDQVSGPIGIVSLVGSAAQFGWVNLLSFTAMLSLNLAVLNIMPFPALDGGRLLFLGIEGVTRRRIKPVVANLVNSVGFLILIGFMIFITVNDVLKLF